MKIGNLRHSPRSSNEWQNLQPILIPLANHRQNLASFSARELDSRIHELRQTLKEDILTSLKEVVAESASKIVSKQSHTESLNKEILRQVNYHAFEAEQKLVAVKDDISRRI